MRSFDRRATLCGIAGLTALGALSSIGARAIAQPRPGATADGVKALVFDVFGTLVDWRNGVARDAQRILAPLGYDLDWIAFAEAWRALYGPSMEIVRSGREPFVVLDVIHRRMLDRIRPDFGLEGLEEVVVADLNLAWHRLDVWPDILPGFDRLREKFLLAPCSNGNIALMVDLARRNGIQWDAILGAEIARDYKPRPRVYLAAAEALNLRPEEVMMVAAHSNDLRNAAALGLRTAHVAKPQERPGQSETGPETEVDFAAQSMIELADQLGA